MNGKFVGVNKLDFDRDIVQFESAHSVVDYASRVSMYTLPKHKIVPVKHLAIREVTMNMPYVTKTGLMSRNSDHLIGGLKSLISNLGLLSALKTLTICRLCYKKKVPKVLGQKRHVSPYIVMNAEDTKIIVEYMNYLINKIAADRAPARRPKPLVKVLNHSW